MQVKAPLSMTGFLQLEMECSIKLTLDSHRNLLKVILMWLDVHSSHPRLVPRFDAMKVSVLGNVVGKRAGF
jgi:hypothetical protein